MTALNWSIGRTFSTHNHPTRFWETHILRGDLCVAVANGATEEESKSIAVTIVEAVNWAMEQV